MVPSSFERVDFRTGCFTSDNCVRSAIDAFVPLGVCTPVSTRVSCGREQENGRLTLYTSSTALELLCHSARVCVCVCLLLSAAP